MVRIHLLLSPYLTSGAGQTIGTSTRSEQGEHGTDIYRLETYGTVVLQGLLKAPYGAENTVGRYI